MRLFTLVVPNTEDRRSTTRWTTGELLLEGLYPSSSPVRRALKLFLADRSHRQPRQENVRRRV
jgi:hypothetical protein